MRNSNHLDSNLVLYPVGNQLLELCVWMFCFVWRVCEIAGVVLWLTLKRGNGPNQINAHVFNPTLMGRRMFMKSTQTIKSIANIFARS